MKTLPDEKSLTSLEICAGAGGQALGVEQAGFHPLALVENDRTACATLRGNRPQWNVIEQDVRHLCAEPYRGVDLFGRRAFPARTNRTAAPHGDNGGANSRFPGRMGFQRQQNFRVSASRQRFPAACRSRRRRRNPPRFDFDRLRHKSLITVEALKTPR